MARTAAKLQEKIKKSSASNHRSQTVLESTAESLQKKEGAMMEEVDKQPAAQPFNGNITADLAKKRKHDAGNYFCYFLFKKACSRVLHYVEQDIASLNAPAVQIIVWLVILKRQRRDGASSSAELC